MRRWNSSGAAFSLVEVTLAIGIAAFCLIAVFGLVPIGVQTNRNATSQTAATNILSSVASDIRASPKGRSLTGQYSIRRSPGVTTTLFFDGQGQFATSLGANSRYRLTVTIASANPELYAATFADLKVTWPAAATLPNASGSLETVVTFFVN